MHLNTGLSFSLRSLLQSESNLMLCFALDLFCNFLFNPLVISWNVIHSKSSGDSSVFSDHACDFLLQHLVFHASVFFFLPSWRKQISPFTAILI